MQDISLLEMLKSGVHFGHQKSRWHPKMKPYIYSVRGGVQIINLEKTQEALQKAVQYIKEVVAKQGTILFVGTKRQAKKIVKKHAEASGAPYITERWLGGLFTNFSTISKLLAKLKRLQADKVKGELDKYTKRERLKFDEKINKLKLIVGGIEDLTKLPDAVFIVDIKKERTCLQESIKMGIPLIALVDTNTNPTLVDYPIPANDDATKSIDLICGIIAQAVADGKEKKQVADLEGQKEVATKTAREEIRDLKLEKVTPNN